MKAYKIIKELDPVIGKKLLGRLLYSYYGTDIMLATETTCQHFMASGYIYRLNQKGYLEEVNLLDEKWIHPHLYKPIKDEVKKLSAQ